MRFYYNFDAFPYEYEIDEETLKNIIEEKSGLNRELVDFNYKLLISNYYKQIEKEHEIEAFKKFNITKRYTLMIPRGRKNR